jgi:hypothetical protein
VPAPVAAATLAIGRQMNPARILRRAGHEDAVHKNQTALHVAVAGVKFGAHMVLERLD